MTNSEKLEARMKKSAKMLSRHEQDMDLAIAYLKARVAKARAETAAMLNLPPRDAE